MFCDRRIDRARSVGNSKIKLERNWLDSEANSNGTISLEGRISTEAPISDNLLVQIDIELPEYLTLLAAKKKISDRFRALSTQLDDPHSALARSGSGSGLIFSL